MELEILQSDNLIRSVILRSSAQWKYYLELLDEGMMNQYKIPVARHHGLPIKFPCIVISNYSEKDRSVNHQFIYLEDANRLIDVALAMRTRLGIIKKKDV